MCTRPILIKNPYHNLGGVGLNFLYNTADSYIEVPCGHCQQCVAMRQGFYLQRVQMESLRSHIYMFTLTYNNESICYTDVGDYHIAVPNYSDITLFFKRLRSSGLQFRYAYVSEYGSRRHRPHFHGLIAVEKSLGLPRVIENQFYTSFFKEWRFNYSDSTRSPVYFPLFTPKYKRARLTTFDFHFVEPVLNHDNDCAYYVSKYITKYDKWINKLIQKVALDDSLEPSEAIFLISLLRPKSVMSKDFGDWRNPVISSYINRCADRKSDYKWPQYYDIYSGKQMPMSPYYGSRIPSYSHMYRLFSKSDGYTVDSFHNDSNDSILEYRLIRDSDRRSDAEFERKLQKLYNRLGE